ncbi:hypothetical protein [Rhizobium wenxiniae]|uniref:PAS fold-4 domain-containing protein n=1 Tax=Rhizobium wenxiniae TaxID=1737357 RepID=A0A7X0D214_9HYPH|nr:hypothetical protein [Rhizobium wenxiniae]MBB6164638.1 hypothetical protein [Rhizobium wenxiniae]
MSEQPSHSDTADQRLANFDWNASALGTIEMWPARILGQAELVIGSRQPMYIALRQDLRFIYNDAYRSILGNRHPGAFGAPMREVFSDIWTELDELFADVLSGTPRVVESTRISTPWKIGRVCWLRSSSTPYRS